MLFSKLPTLTNTSAALCLLMLALPAIAQAAEPAVDSTPEKTALKPKPKKIAPNIDLKEVAPAPAPEPPKDPKAKVILAVKFCQAHQRAWPGLLAFRLPAWHSPLRYWWSMASMQARLCA